MKLKVSESLSLPLDAVTQTFLVVGKRGSGKSNTAARLVEQMHHARLPFVVLDPVDTWWGLKAGRDGSKGLDVYVFGGRKQDLPLEAGGGALIADVLCEHRMSMVLSVKHLSGRERSAFMVDFARTLFQKWAGGPLHVVLEEAHELAPQNTQNAKEGEQQMLGAFKRLWKLGRSSGIGGTAVTQRPASLSKDITTQSEILIAHRTIGPQDVKAVGEWVKYHGEHQDILSELPSLPTGEAFVWAPEFPEGKPIGLTRTSVLLRDTYDSASTPKVGEARVEPKELAEVDLEQLRAKMAATIEKAKAEDPRELRKQIAELKKQLQAPSSKLLASHVETKTIEKFVLKDGQLTRAERILATVDSLIGRAESVIAEMGGEVVQELRKTTNEITAAIASTRAPHPQPPAPRVPRAQPAASPGRPSTPVRPAVAAGSNGHGDIRLNRLAERKVLQVLVQYGSRTKQQLAIQAGYAASGGGFNGALSKLKTAGYIVTEPSGLVAVTPEGAAAIGDVEPLPAGAALVAHWMQQFNRLAEREVLRVVVEAYPHALSAEEVASRTNPQYEPKGGGFNGAVSKLRTLGLIHGRGELKASDELFD